MTLTPDNLLKLSAGACAIAAAWAAFEIRETRKALRRRRR